jgi:hypothetical protein
LCFHLLTAQGLRDIGAASPGSADRNRTLSQRGLIEIQVPVPSLEEQVWFDRLFDTVQRMDAVRTKPLSELEALGPAIRVTEMDPKLGETVLDPACGTGGFLVEAFTHGAVEEQNVRRYRSVRSEYTVRQTYDGV